MSFINEHTWAGEAGYLLLIIAFVTTLSAATSYIIAAGRDEVYRHVWLRFSRFLLMVHTVALLAAIGLLFWMIANHYFEYHYVWKYSSLAMEAKYIFSCFWSGQEGSFLLWAFWIAVLAWFVVGKRNTWEAPVLIFVMVIQGFLISMVLGVYAGDVRIGSSPFILIRQLPENAVMPWANMTDYLQRITSFHDGVGLNPLLQNYWMTIHPPVLFLGFAATVFPFAYAMAALVRKEYQSWLKPALTWSVFSVMVLGTGILLGGAWAYESLSFGGFWAWDPVENASLVPWLLAVVGLHYLHISEKRRRGLFLSLMFSAAPLVFVVYSSFLTRSGILGESSVHSFTENGLFIHLIIFLFGVAGATVFFLLTDRRSKLLFLVLSAICLITWFITESLPFSIGPWLTGTIILLLYSYENAFVKSTAEEIQRTSREFWMFAGGLVIVMSALQITLSTSIPVINKIFGTRLDAFTELASRNVFYHTWQIPLAIIICVLIGVTQFLQYRKTGMQSFRQNIKRAAIASAVLFIIALFWLRYNPAAEWQFVLLLFAAIVAVVFNIDFARKLLARKVSNAASPIAHIGFALLLTGALVSGSRKNVISSNASSFSLQELNKDFKNHENILLKQGDTVLMKEFFVHYRGREMREGKLHYEITYYEPRNTGSLNRLVPGDSSFTLYPLVQLNEKFGNVSEPGTKHFITRDVFTHIKYADMQAGKPETPNDGFMSESTFKIQLGAEARLENYSFRFRDIGIITSPVEKETAGFRSDDIVVKAVLGVKNLDQEDAGEFLIEPLFVVRDSVTVIPQELYSSHLDARLRIVEIPQEPNTIVMGIRQREFIVMQAYIFPGMNLLWSGCVLMVLGCFIGWRDRAWGRREKKLAHQVVPQEG